MIFRSIVILCALSACAANKDSVSQPMPKPAEKAPTSESTSEKKAPNPEADLKRANSLIRLGQAKKALKVLAKWETVTDAPNVSEFVCLAAVTIHPGSGRGTTFDVRAEEA